MKQKKEITIYDIAKKLKYSTSTISRALRDHHSIGKSTKELIKKEAEKMGYRPNSLAAGLRNNRSKTIGVLISRINRPFMSSLISGIEDEAKKAGYTVIIIQCNDSYESEVQNARTLYDMRISGIITSLSMETVDYSHFEPFLHQQIPIVFVDRVPESFPSYNIVIDNYASGYKATEHLIKNGCKRIAHFAGSQNRNIYKERRRGYEDALRAYDLPVFEELIIQFETLSAKEGKKATKQLMSLENPPDGIFSSNDTAAVSAIQYAKKNQIKIPEDLAIIGFNNDPVCSIIEPGLSSITHPASKMGKLSAKCILNHLEHTEIDTTLTQVTILETDLISRQSSLKI
ncbi:LacI family DNA-binding transcriptional regulator [Leeuwenhoekiella sp. W20_SRS_FM14]|uniref:LacI family DNA-binding transcriptional regulator n=1 Tax=Leeuwenhoekiella sp. W20_SRS_FM14 TaxID=3240270 RepID=UPI003F9E5C20